jgi:hypothetical protein
LNGKVALDAPSQPGDNKAVWDANYLPFYNQGGFKRQGDDLTWSGIDAPSINVRLLVESDHVDVWPTANANTTYVSLSQDYWIHAALRYRGASDAEDVIYYLASNEYGVDYVGELVRNDLVNDPSQSFKPNQGSTKQDEWVKNGIRPTDEWFRLENGELPFAYTPPVANDAMNLLDLGGWTISL